MTLVVNPFMSFVVKSDLLLPGRDFLLWAFPRQTHRVFMRALTEASLYSPRQRDARLTILVAQPICRRKRLLPPLLSVAFQQVKLRGLILQPRRLHAQQPHWR